MEVSIGFEGVTSDQQPPDVVAYAYDPAGRFLGSAPVQRGKASLGLPREAGGRMVRVVVAPRLEAREQPKLSELKRLQGYERRLRLDPEKAALDLTIVEPIWRCWILCACVVRGRVVKNLTLPDGSVRELPICHARVTICEVEQIPWIIWHLPDDLLARLRDELVAVVKPWPPPPPDHEVETPVIPLPPPGGGQGPGPSPVAMTASVARPGLRSALSGGAGSAPLSSATAELGFEQQRATVLSVAGVESSLEVRRALVSAAGLVQLYICRWDWLWPFFRYSVDCVETVMVDADGSFSATLWRSCCDPAPNLYVSVEQLHGLVWESIYDPGARCATHWSYDCGSEIVVNVTDPSAVPCVPPDPVNPPDGVVTWIMPYAVGGTLVWGSPVPAAPAPPGWVRTDGFTDYGGLVSAPFGGYLGFRHGYSWDIPSAGIGYYRWSYRKAGGTAWSYMLDPVVRHYVKQSPGVLLPSFPAFALGPHTVGPSSGLFQFKPDAPPGPGPGDPPGTVTYWPPDDFFGDIYSGYLNTPALPPSVLAAAGQYQVKLEVFDAGGNLVAPGAGTFEFIVPSGVEADSSVDARQALATEIDAGGFVFNLVVDNNHCTAAIDAPVLGGTAAADVCGFLRYDKHAPAPVTIAFQAHHPNGRATFTFSIVRGAIWVPGAGAGGEIWAAAAAPYAGDGSGDFTHDFTLTELLDTCEDAAFAESLYVYAKATTGWGTRISDYDAWAPRAFALAEQKGP